MLSIFKLTVTGIEKEALPLVGGVYRLEFPDGQCNPSFHTPFGSLDAGFDF